MTKYEALVAALARGEEPTMKVFGNSMTPLLFSGVVLTFKATDDYQVGDVVVSKVRGRWSAAHKITKIDAAGRFMIANNKGHENGWASKVFGRVIKADGKPFGRAVNEVE